MAVGPCPRFPCPSSSESDCLVAVGSALRPAGGIHKASSPPSSCQASTLLISIQRLTDTRQTSAFSYNNLNISPALRVYRYNKLQPPHLSSAATTQHLHHSQVNTDLQQHQTTSQCLLSDLRTSLPALGPRPAGLCLRCPSVAKQLSPTTWPSTGTTTWISPLAPVFLS